jgi:predicted dinucleotide-binding enzyme
MANVGIIGSGIVGRTLADGFLKHGYNVAVGTGNTGKLSEWKSKAGANARVGSFAEAAAFGDIVVLAVKGTAAAEAIERTGPSALAGKTVIDTTNPIADAPPLNGVLKYFTSLDESLMEKLQKTHPSINFVKAFSCVGNAFMVNPRFPGGTPTMFICGNDAGAKAAVTKILDLFGWETEDLGKAESARAIEPLCILWCIPGFQRNQWTHALKLLKM